MMILFSQLAFATPVLSTVNDSITEYNRYSLFDIPHLNQKQMAKLNSGEVVTILDRADKDSPQRAIGVLVTTVPAKQLWLSCQDAHFSQQSSTTEQRITLYPDNSADWYGFLDLPWPFSDRHWVVNVSDNQAMAKATNNRCWEHPWKLVLNGAQKIYPYCGKGKLKDLEASDLDAAIYTPVNEGAWALIQLEHSNLFVYHATTVVGGSIPSDLVVQLVESSLEDMLKGIEARAKQDIVEHYRGNHSLILGGDGKTLSLYQ